MREGREITPCMPPFDSRRVTCRDSISCMNRPSLYDIQTLQLPPDIRARVEYMQQTNEAKYTADEDRRRIGTAGYTPADASILHDAVVALALGKNLLFKGPTGSGKTKLAEHLSWLLQQPMQAVNCSVDLDLEGLLGFKTLTHTHQQTQIEFIAGPVIEAMTKGQMLYIDEINMAKPETLPILNGVLDYRRRITNPFTSEIVDAAEGFQVIAAINEGYIGTVPLNEALKNRFVVIDVPYLQGDRLKALLDNSSGLHDDVMLDLFVRLSADLLEQVRLGQIPDEAASIRGLIDACDLALHMPPLRAIRRTIADKLEDERERAAVLNIAETWFAEHSEG